MTNQNTVTPAPRLLTVTEARRIDEKRVCSIPEPPFTATWHPHSHKKVVEATAMALEKFKIPVEEKTYSLSTTGANMMGLWTIGKKDGKHNSLAFRNSTDMTWAVGFSSFLTVIVCTNQITHANWFVLRRHTSGLTVEQLGELAEGAIEQVLKDFDVVDDWHESLKETKLEKRRLEQLTVQAMRKDILVPSKFKEFDELLFGANGDKPIYDRTLYGFHGALTQVIRNDNLHLIAERNQKITKFVNTVRGGH